MALETALTTSEEANEEALTSSANIMLHPTTQILESGDGSTSTLSSLHAETVVQSNESTGVNTKHSSRNNTAY